MIASDAVALVLLAAGASSRFGRKDKLAEPLGGLALGLHAARMLSAVPFAARIVVTRDGGPDFAPFAFTRIVNHEPGLGQSSSIRLGLDRARAVRPRAVMIALADMPFVTRGHVEALMARFEETDPRVGSTDGMRVSPPALFGAATFASLAALAGDAGARALLRDAALVAASPGELRDIDTPADLSGVVG